MASPPANLANRQGLLLTYSKKSLLKPLCVIWGIIIVTGEVFIFTFDLSRCPWPQRKEWQASISSTGKKPYRIALIADPQIIDKYSYERSPLLIRLTQIITDQYMRKAWKTVQRSLDADAYVFLGDLMDGGREWSNEKDWMDEMKRFKKLFRLRRRKPVYYIAGNHDVGFGDAVVWNAQNRFREHFASPNYSVDVGNHSLVMIDVTALGSKEPRIRGQAQMFLEDKGRTTPSLPRILFSHVPLWRPPLTSCGAKRQSNTVIRQGIGRHYQNILFEPESTMLLQNVKPEIIFTGDDHDYCEVIHSVSYPPSSKPRDVVEIAVNTFSFAMGVDRPGLQLLTLYNPDKDAPSNLPFQTYDTEQCLLPDQMGVFITYLTLAIPTIVIILLHSYWRLKVANNHLPLFKRKVVPSGRPKSKKINKRVFETWRTPLVWTRWLMESIKLFAFGLGTFTLCWLWFWL